MMGMTPPIQSKMSFLLTANLLGHKVHLKYQNVPVNKYAKQNARQVAIPLHRAQASGKSLGDVVAKVMYSKVVRDTRLVRTLNSE